MSNKPIYFVAGLGRCGLTATMQMLWIGGVPYSGEPPAFEDMHLSLDDLDIDWVRAQSGRALKWVDPANNPLPQDINCKIIWLDRNFKDQARSQIKFVSMLHGTPFPKSAISAMTATLKADRQKALRNLRKMGPLITVKFSDVIKKPNETAKTIQGFLGPDVMPRPDLAERLIIPRPSRCQPDLSIEAQAGAAWDRTKENRSENVGI